MGATRSSERIMGLDGKSYPRRPISRAARLNVILAAHALHHAGQPMRAIAGHLRCSIGTVHSHLTTWRCEECRSGVPLGTPEHATGGN